MKSKTRLSLVILAFILILIVQNLEPISVRMLFWDVPLSGSLFFFVLFTTGSIFGWLLQGFSINDYTVAGKGSDIREKRSEKQASPVDRVHAEEVRPEKA